MDLDFATRVSWYALICGELLAGAVNGFGSVSRGAARHAIAGIGCLGMVLPVALSLPLYGWLSVIPLPVAAYCGVQLGSVVFFKTYRGATGQDVVFPHDVTDAAFQRWFREAREAISAPLPRIDEAAMRGRHDAYDRMEAASEELMEYCLRTEPNAAMLRARGWEKEDLRRMCRVFEGNAGRIAWAMTLCRPELLEPFLGYLDTSDSMADAARAAAGRVGVPDRFFTA